MSATETSKVGLVSANNRGNQLHKGHDLRDCKNPVNWTEMPGKHCVLCLIAISQRDNFSNSDNPVSSDKTEKQTLTMTVFLTSSCSVFRPAIEKCPMSARSIAKHYCAHRTQQESYDMKALWWFQWSHTGQKFPIWALVCADRLARCHSNPRRLFGIKKKKSLPWKNSTDQHFSPAFPALNATITMPFKVGPLLSPSSMYSLWSGQWKRPTQRWAAWSRCAFHMVNSFGWACHCALP